MRQPSPSWRSKEFLPREGSRNPTSRNFRERMVDEAERSLKDALSVVIDVVKKNRIVAGGGAVETELAKRIRDYATKIGGREQLAVEAFADAMEAIPRTLSENAGLDQVDILVALRAAHEAKGLWSGINVYTGEITDMM